MNQQEAYAEVVDQFREVLEETALDIDAACEEAGEPQIRHEVKIGCVLAYAATIMGEAVARGEGGGLSNTLEAFIDVSRMCIDELRGDGEPHPAAVGEVGLA